LKKKRKDQEILIQFGVKGFTSKIYCCGLKQEEKAHFTNLATESQLELLWNTGYKKTRNNRNRIGMHLLSNPKGF
jgi:hypothetical protein